MARLFRSLLERKREAARSAAPHRDYVADEIRRRRDRAPRAERAATPREEARSLVARGPAALESERRGTPNGLPAELTRGIDPAVLRLFTPQIAREFGLLPINVTENRVLIGIAREPSLKIANDIRWLLSIGSDRGLKPVFEQIPNALLQQCLDVYYPYAGESALLPAPAELFRLFAPAARGSDDVLRPPASGRATVRSLVDGILLKAVYRGANDILFECFEKEFRVRFKVEGSCEHALAPLPPSAAPQVISILKQHARLDIAETERSQDGRFDMKVERGGEIKSVQFRVAIRPTINGEGCVIRLHDNGERRPSLESLGADPRTLAALHRVRDHRGGLVVFCGPTGSGKTTTLAAILGACDSTKENIVTIEDPVEIRLPGVTQSAVNEAKGETFARMLKTTLRVAPDRILVGEVRDNETAHLVIKAALTGHQVLTTVHSDDAPRAITRMLEEGISPFNLASVLFLVVAQRLVNRLCEHCAVDVSYPAEILVREQFRPDELDEVHARESRGCSICAHRGTHGRIAIYETLVVTDAIRDVVARRPDDMEAIVRRTAILSGMRPLRRTGLDLVKAGRVSLQQIVESTPYVPHDALAESLGARAPFDPRLQSDDRDWIRPLEIGEGERLDWDARGPIILGAGAEPPPDETEAIDYDLLETIAEHARGDARDAFFGDDWGEPRP